MTPTRATFLLSLLLHASPCHSSESAFGSEEAVEQWLNSIDLSSADSSARTFISKWDKTSPLVAKDTLLTSSAFGDIHVMSYWAMLVAPGQKCSDGSAGLITGLSHILTADECRTALDAINNAFFANVDSWTEGSPPPSPTRPYEKYLSEHTYGIPTSREAYLQQELDNQKRSADNDAFMQVSDADLPRGCSVQPHRLMDGLPLVRGRFNVVNGSEAAPEVTAGETDDGYSSFVVLCRTTSTLPPPPSPPPSPPPIFESTPLGQSLLWIIVGGILLLGGILCFYFKVSSASKRWRVGPLREWAKEQKAKGFCARAWSTPAAFIVPWLCVENIFEQLTQILNLIASGSANPMTAFWITFVINIVMFLLETWEYCRMRKRRMSDKSPEESYSRWDAFWFGEWETASNKLYWSKMSHRITLLFELAINVFVALKYLSIVPYIDALAASSLPELLRLQKEEELTGVLYALTAYASGIKNFSGFFSLVEILGYPLLFGFLCDKCEERNDEKKCAPRQLRFGPFASSDGYNHNDFLISNLMNYILGFLYACNVSFLTCETLILQGIPSTTLIDAVKTMLWTLDPSSRNALDSNFDKSVDVDSSHCILLFGTFNMFNEEQGYGNLGGDVPFFITAVYLVAIVLGFVLKCCAKRKEGASERAPDTHSV